MNLEKFMQCQAKVMAGQELTPEENLLWAKFQVQPGQRKKKPNGTVYIRVKGKADPVVFCKKCWFHDKIEVVQSALFDLSRQDDKFAKFTGHVFTPTTARNSGLADSCQTGNNAYSALRTECKNILAQITQFTLDWTRAENKDVKDGLEKQINTLKDKVKEKRKERKYPIGYDKTLTFETREDAIAWCKKHGVQVVEDELAQA